MIGHSVVFGQLVNSNVLGFIKSTSAANSMMPSTFMNCFYVSTFSLLLVLETEKQSRTSVFLGWRFLDAFVAI